ncbi:FG-GAP-like repeat-containing protein [Streptomyces sp. NPDC047974]|uniref:FG-GAP-like repeat-containing protein n=1 Tax=Streptomyces sp. NPDC047974 TaxID=3154343 RepID=UPI00340B3C21
MSRTAPARRTRARAALVLALATVTAATSAGIVAPPAVADTAPQTTVLPAAPRFSPRATSILNAGETGYLLAQEGDARLQWIDYATGKATPLAVTLPEAPRYNYVDGYWDYNQRPLFLGDTGYWGDGSDTVALHSATPAPHVTLQKGAGAVFADIVIPPGQEYVGTYGDTVLTRTGTAEAPTAYHLLRYDSVSGKVTAGPITGFPEGAVLGGLEDADATSLVLRYKESAGETWNRWRIVDIADGVAKELPDRPNPEQPWAVSGFRLGAGTILRDGVAILDRAAPHTLIRAVGSHGSSYRATLAPVGTAVLAVEPQNPGDNEYRGAELWNLPEAGESLSKPLLQRAYTQIVLTPQGDALVAGAETAEPSGDVDWAIFRISPTADGGVTKHRLRTIAPMPAEIFGLSLGSGILTTAANSTHFYPGGVHGVYRSTWMSTVAGQPQPVRTTVDAPMTSMQFSGYEPPGQRPYDRITASGDGAHGLRGTTLGEYTVLYRNGERDWGPYAATTGDRLTDLSGRFGVVVTDVPGDEPSVVRFKGAGDAIVTRRAGASLAAVWGSSLWSVAKGSPKISSESLTTGAAGASFTTPNSCLPTELQAAGRWVYWSCEDSEWGPAQGSGVYDRKTGRTMAVPGRNIRNVLLGDGYLVQQDATAGLRLHDLSAGLPATGSTVPTRVLVGAAALGQWHRAGWGWTVDRFGGHVAYAGTDQRVRIVDTGVDAPPVDVIDSSVTGASLNLASSGAGWSGRWWTSKPTGAWKVTVKEKATGTVVRTVSGAEARGRIDAGWTGKDGSGKAARNGAYTWTLTARPADGIGADLSLTGSLTVSGGAPAPQPAWRDLSGDGKGDLLGLTSAGQLAVRTGTGTGGLGTGAVGSGWPASSVTVPFGDLSGDGCADLLVRDSAGTLTRYDGSCGKAAFVPGGPRRTIGGGWQIYNALTAPGDLTGDGRPDLLARTPAGQLWLYADNGSGAFTTRTLIGGGWQTYDRIVGTGDLTGDKHGDLVARDTTGVLWRYLGTGKGNFGVRVRIGGGWQTYNALVGVGDLTGDGRADMVARDTTGMLWRYTGSGAGQFAGRVQIGGGWQMYRTLS